VLRHVFRDVLGSQAKATGFLSEHWHRWWPMILLY
jgi:hypothetical protein